MHRARGGNLRESQILEVIEGKEQAVARRQCREGQCQRLLETRKQPRSINSRDIGMPFAEPIAARSSPRFIVKALRGACRCVVSLGKRTQPGGQLASAVKIIEQRRFPLAAVAFQTVQLGVQRIGQFVRPRFAARTDNRASRATPHGPLAKHKFLPRGIRTIA